ncbi:thermonuclease family protein [Algibacillus agarilyticus]|uniref:thermonuclease family protein n=1 Tax=Algibacillus agarilyticus TaxID=2234133 RepID=UPI000DD01083|nr:thermonuclease family protein [Algibacillus agarilyticus]
MRLTLLFILCFFSTTSLANKCASAFFEQTEQIASVIDGDTVRLKDGNLIRFIGIDTPEINHKNLPKSEPFALSAKDYLQKLIGPSNIIQLRYDKELLDVYNRMLAHAYTDKGVNIQAALLEQGYATHQVYGANDKFWPCYRQHENIARNHQRHIWGHKKWQPTPVRIGNLNSKKYREYYDTVTNVWSDDSGTTWIVLNKLLYVGLEPDDLKKLKGVKIDKNLINYKMVIKGKPYFKASHWRISLTHPWQMILPSELNNEKAEK